MVNEAMSLTKQEKDILLELITNEQIKYLIPKYEYQSSQYILLERLKSKIKIM